MLIEKYGRFNRKNLNLQVHENINSPEKQKIEDIIKDVTEKENRNGDELANGPLPEDDTALEKVCTRLKNPKLCFLSLIKFYNGMLFLMQNFCRNYRLIFEVHGHMKFQYFNK